MKKIRVEDAIGLKLAHDVTAMYDGFKGAAFKMGHVISKNDIKKLLDYGKKNVFVLEKKDLNKMHEVDACKNLMKISKTKNTHFSAISEGKAILYSNVSGMFTIDKTLLKRINQIQDITITTIPNHSRVVKGDRLASMRIVPLFTDKKNITHALSISKGKKLFSVYEYKKLNVGIIITGSEIYNGRIKDKFEPIARKKLSEFPCEIKKVVICDDDLTMLMAKIKEMIKSKYDLIIMSGGMSVDADDITPLAIKKVGANIVTHGIPMQPGNMTLVSYYKDTCILGVPGAAISMPRTSFDCILPQVFTKIKFTKDELYGLSEGGLCKMCDICHFPNCTYGRY